MSTQVKFRDEFYARGYAVMGRTVAVGNADDVRHNMLIATVNPNIKTGEVVAAEIAASLNTTFNGV